MSDIEERPFRPWRANGHGAGIVLQPAPSVLIDRATEYGIKGIVHFGDFSVLYGESGCGKTFAALDMAHALATGRGDYFGRRVRACPVALFALEGSAGLPKRLIAIQKQHGPAPALFVYRKPLTLFENPGLVADVIAAIRNCDARVAMFDTLSRMMSGANENSSEDMTHMVGVVDRIRAETGAHVMLVHHSGKNQAAGARGHSSLRAAADVEMEIEKLANSERLLRITKGRDDADGQQFGFRLQVVHLGEDEDGDPISTCVVESCTVTMKPKAAKLNAGDTQALAWLKEAIEEYGTPSPYGVPSGCSATTREKWSEIARKRTGETSTETLRKAIYRAITNLTAAKVIGVSDPYFWVLKP